MYYYDDLIEAIIDLEERGYTLDFAIGDTNLFCVQGQSPVARKEFTIREVYHFTGKDDGERISLYGIEAPAFCVKGILLERGSKSTKPLPSFFQRKIEEYMHHRVPVCGADDQ